MYSKSALGDYYDNGPPQDEMREVLKQKAHDLFTLCDKEEKGYAFKQDMHCLTIELGLSTEQLGEVFDVLDKDKNGCLTLQEFTEGLGMFLGVDCQLFQGDEDMNGDKTRTFSTTKEQEDEDEQFEDFLDHLGANNVFKDEDYIRHMWDKVKKDDPSVMENFENFLGKITQELKTTKNEYSILENTLKSRSNTHEDQVQALYHEMEQQLQSEKEELLAKERSKEQKIRSELEMELQLKDKQLQDLLIEHVEMEKHLEELNALDSETKYENIKLHKERDGLEIRLSASEKMLKDMQSQLESLRKRGLQEKRKRAKAALKVSEDIALEREGLVKQLCELKKVNKQLLDEKDELVLSATSTPINISEDESPSSPLPSNNLFPQSSSGKILNSTHSPNLLRNNPKVKLVLTSNSSLSFSESTQTSPDPCTQIRRIPASNDPLIHPLAFEGPSIADCTVGEVNRNSREEGTIHSPLGNYLTSSKSEDECEVDDYFFQSNPHLIGLPEDDGILLQNNLNLTPSPKFDNSGLEKIPRVNDDNLREGRRTPAKESKPTMDSSSNSDARVKLSSHNQHTQETNELNQNEKNPDSSPQRVFKIVFIGDSGVGKTSIIHRFCHDTFKPTFNATVGVDFQVKTVRVDGRLVALQLWDTAGQERFRSITQQYYRKADGIVVVYDVTSETSFKSVRNWMIHIKEGADENVVLLLIGNKIDLCDSEEDRVVRTKHGSRVADEFGTLFYETSAKEGDSVTEALTALSSLLQVKEDEVIERVLKLQEGIKCKKKKCC